MKKKPPITREQAEETAVAALAYVAADPNLLPRFLALTGIDPGAVRKAAAEPGFLAGVIDFIIGHEPTLMAFSEASGLPPETLGLARRALPGGDERFERQGA